MSNIYKYISKNKNKFQILKDNEDFGTYSKLTDALYERDRLVKAEWDWDKLMELEETENFYEKMKLPPFLHEFSYIYLRPTGYEVYVDDEYYGRFNNKTDAHEFAKQVNGRVEEYNHVYRVQKRVDGVHKTFGQYKTYEEAKKRRDELMKKGWVE